MKRNTHSPGFWDLKKVNVISGNETCMRALSSHCPSLSATEQKRAVHFKYRGAFKNKGKQIYLWSISYFIFNFQRYQRLKTKIASYFPFGHAATEGFAYAINDRSWEVDGGTSSCTEVVIQRGEKDNLFPLNLSTDYLREINVLQNVLLKQLYLLN